MYSREYPREQSRGAVKAFEDAYAKEEFLRRSASGGTDAPGCTAAAKDQLSSDEIPDGKHPVVQSSGKDCGLLCENDTAKHKGGLAGILNNFDSGDIILLLLIVFFLFDSDKENDSLIPVLLAVLLLF